MTELNRAGWRPRIRALLERARIPAFPAGGIASALAKGTWDEANVIELCAMLWELLDENV